MEELRALAEMWKKKPRSGKQVMHGVPAVRFCRWCGRNVSAWHEHYTKKKEFAIARSAWMAKPEDPPKSV